MKQDKTGQNIERNIRISVQHKLVSNKTHRIYPQQSLIIAPIICLPKGNGKLQDFHLISFMSLLR